MTTALTIIPDNTIATATQYLESFGNKLTKDHKNQFLQIASAFNLNPFTREIYGIPFGDKFNIIVGYEVYLKRAETSGMLAGWRSWTEGEGSNMKGCIEITRKDWNAPFYHEVYFSEYNQNNNMWKAKPMTMIKKVAIAQGMRMAFPVELGGMPYTSDEMPAIEPTQQQIPIPGNSNPGGISKDIAGQIVKDLKQARININAFMNVFKIKKLSEIEISQLMEIANWISKNAVEVLDVTTGEIIEEALPAEDQNQLQQDVLQLLELLATAQGETPDDMIDILTNHKLGSCADLLDKPIPYLNDIKLMILAKLEQ